MEFNNEFSSSDQEPEFRSENTVGELEKYKEYIFSFIENEVRVLKYAPDKLKSDKEIVLKVVKHNGLALKYVSKELQNDRVIVINALENDFNSLIYASVELQYEFTEEEKNILQYLQDDKCFKIDNLGKLWLNNKK